MASYTVTHAEGAYAADAALMDKFIWLQDHAHVTETTQQRSLLVGQTNTGYGYRLEPFHDAWSENLEPGDSYSLVLEDQFDYVAVFDAVVRVLNMESRNLLVSVIRTFTATGEQQVLASELTTEHGLLDVALGHPMTKPTKRAYHTVTITSNETSRDAQVGVCLSGWAAVVTKFPVENAS